MLKEMKHQPLDQYIEDYASEIPSVIAINFYGKEITYKELNDEINIFANYLLDSGIKKGDVVALYLQNCPQYIIAFYATQRIGAIAGPCNPMFKEWELAFQLTDLNAKILITSSDLYPIYLNIEEKMPVEKIVLINYQDYLPKNPMPSFPENTLVKKYDNTDIWQDIFENPLYNHVATRADLIMEQDVSMIIYTSGTTGVPKGAMLTYKNSEYQAFTGAKHFQFGIGDKMLNVMPIFHIAGKLVGMMTSFISGATTILLIRFNPKEHLQAIEVYKPKFIITTVPMNVSMLGHDLIETTDFSTLQHNVAVSFGIQLSQEISDAWQAKTGIALQESGYGMTETHTLNTMLPLDIFKVGANGAATKGTTIIIVDPTDYSKQLEKNERGVILIKGPSIFKGYKGRWQDTGKSFFGEYFITEDLGLFDDDGYLVFLGRVSELIKSSGYNVYPEEVEKMLAKNEAVKEVAVVGIPDEIRGESAKAFIVLNEGATLDEMQIIDWAKQKMAAYKYPREVEFIEELPKTNSGKVLRRVLKDRKE